MNPFLPSHSIRKNLNYRINVSNLFQNLFFTSVFVSKGSFENDSIKHPKYLSDNLMKVYNESLIKTSKVAKRTCPTQPTYEPISNFKIFNDLKE